MKWMDRHNPPAGFDAESIQPPPIGNNPRPIKSMAIDIAGSKCNLACRYCSEEAAQPSRKEMSPETLDATCRFLFSNNLKDYTIHLGCGEPLLSLKLLKQLARHVENARTADGEKPKVTVFLTSNALLMNEPVMDWLIQSGWRIKISFDGPPSIQNRWRILPDGSPTYSQVEKAVKYLAERQPDRLGICAVVCQGTDPAEVFEAIESLGVRRIELIPVAHRDESIRLTPGDCEKYRDFIFQYANRLEQEIEKPPAILPKFQIFAIRLMGYSLSRVMCTAGRSYIGVGPEGDIYPCSRFIGLEEYKTGNIIDGIDIDALTNFNKTTGRAYEHRETCKDCWAAPLCTGPCFAFEATLGPGDGNPDPAFCAYSLATAEAAVDFVNRNREHNPERLIPLLPFNTDSIWE